MTTNRKYPFQHIVTKLRTTKGSPYALDVMSEAADWIENAIESGLKNEEAVTSAIYYESAADGFDNDLTWDEAGRYARSALRVIYGVDETSRNRLGFESNEHDN